MGLVYVKGYSFCCKFVVVNNHNFFGGDCQKSLLLIWQTQLHTRYMYMLQADVKDKAAETEGPEDVVVHDSIARPASPQHRWHHQRYRPLHGDGADSPFNADSSDGSL